MTAAEAQSCAWTRGEAIDRLREHLLTLADGEQSMCRIASERGIFCRGFRRWGAHEFHDRWKAILGVSTHLTRPQTERLADLWQLTEQLHARVELICDAQAMRPGACRGWAEFNNLTLATYCRELLDRNVVVTDGKPDDANALVSSRLFMSDSR